MRALDALSPSKDSSRALPPRLMAPNLWRGAAMSHPGCVVPLMTQNIYDTQTFFDQYSQLDRSIEGLGGAPEWPALRALLPDPRGLRIVDLGCGFGWFCRWAAEQGAAHVRGLDISEKMLARAAATNAHATITYIRADLERLDLPEASFDIVYTSLALHYVEDLAGLVKNVHRAMVAGGHLVFSIEHPIYMASMHPRWLVDRDGGKSWPVDHYLVEGQRTTDWLAKGVVKQHRTIGTTLNLLIQTGFTIAHVEEWCPTDEQIAANPELAEERERPMFLLIAARR
jgi:SAM-dependent methyltransferase